MTEEWRPVPGHEAYEISNLGRVRTVRYLRKRPDRAGYLRIAISKNGKCVRQASIQRLVAETFIENTDGKPEVNHIDGDKSNNRVDNLEWVTPSENRLHAFEIGLMKPISGSRNVRAKLCEDDVRQIRDLMAQGVHNRVLAPMFGVSRATIQFIRLGESWKHVAPPEASPPCNAKGEA
jgi:hypothetical protein